jgi:hypothetical protein
MSIDPHDKILGSWRLLSMESESQATGERRFSLGENPMGYILFISEGRFMAVLTREGLKMPSTEQDWASLAKSVYAYTGTYRLEGDQWITRVDASSWPAWIGTEQVRYFRIDGDMLYVTSGWMEGHGGDTVRATLKFEREK